MAFVAAHDEHVRLVCSIAEIQMRALSPPPLSMEMPVLRLIAAASADNMWVSTKTILDTTHLSASMVMQVLTRLQRRGLVHIGSKGKTTYVGVPFANVIRDFVHRVHTAIASAKSINSGTHEFQCKDCTREYWIHNLASMHCPIYNEPRCVCGGEVEVVWCKHLPPTMFPNTPIRKFLEDDDDASSMFVKMDEAKRVMLGELEGVRTHICHNISHHTEELGTPTWLEFDNWVAMKRLNSAITDNNVPGGCGTRAHVEFAPECMVSNPLDIAVDKLMKLSKHMEEEDAEEGWEDY
jgi:hypothetical protein